MTAQPYAPPPAMPPVKPAKFAALAWAALILGIIGVVGSPIIFLNNLTAVIAGVGFILGAIALFGSKKILAGIGVALCVAAIVFTVIAQQAAVEKLDEILNGTTNQGQVGNAGRGEGGVPADSPTWGKRYTWESGLAVDVTAPAACKPSDSAAPPNIERAVKITVTVTNGTSEPFDATLLSLGGDAQFNGARADQVYDFGGECAGGLESATVLPGKTFTYSVAYAVGPQPGEMQISFQPAFGADKAIYVGEA
ncbi:hypothetical protein [Amycolatopsis sp. 195334CR]|uniref:hypothetical protein n=1 Tax=Amycolatopsis sp. 195334CR TaxID=2814588 RepID=UPI001A8C5D2F|nr:hypothetical protein [Amycolatopsis sp. 195334CR]MBN6035995.1 hypothetical protein [Amycolatopsis sp. 195334CR]